MDISQNMLLSIEGEKTIRVLYINEITSILCVIDMDSDRWPYAIKKESLKNIGIIDDDKFCRAVCEEELSDIEKQKREFAWEVVIYIISRLNEELIYISKYRTKVIKEAMDKYKISYNSIKGYLIKYWKGGQVKNSLLPNFFNCGAKGKERNSTGVKRGRPCNNEKSTGVNIDDTIKKFFKTGLNRYYYNERKNSLKTTYELIIKDFFTEEKVEQNGISIPVLTDASKIPTYQQFLYWFKKFNNIRTEVSKRNGSRIYYQKYRTIIGDATQDGDLGPATLWQIDSTIFDIYLVSSFNRDLVVGRPVLYLVIDVYSRLIVGLNITFESFNSYTGAMVALVNSMSSKKEFCSKYGIEINESDWPVACVPQRILADRGELNGKQIENAIKNLGITIQNSPPYRADYKGIIEQGFHQMNLKVKPFVEGVVTNSKNVIERGEKDYRIKSTLTIEELTNIVIKCILFHNNYHVLSDYIVDEMMIEEEVEKIPIKIWEYGLKNKKGKLRILPEDTIKLSLYPTDTASVTSKGVAYKKMLFASEYTLKNNWFQIARAKGTWKVTISYNPSDLTDIYVMDDNGRSYHKLTLLEHLSKFSKKDYTEIEQIIMYEESLEKKSKEKELQKKIELFNDIENIAKLAKEKTDAQTDNSKSKAEKIRDIKENRTNEKLLHRGLSRQNYKENELDSVTTSNSGDEETIDDLQMFKELQSEEW